MKNLDPITTQQYIEKADHFLRAMKKLAVLGLAPHRTGIALLAVHSAISLNDAITAGVTGKRGKHQGHLDAVTELERISREHHIENRSGIGQFRGLLAEKTRIAYGNERLDDSLVLLSISRAERFHAWAYNYFKEILHDSVGA
ncbi:MAG: hypothetical protein WCD47_08430 [Candidatus Sulfotelmatobacter sp.]